MRYVSPAQFVFAAVLALTVMLFFGIAESRAQPPDAVSIAAEIRLLIDADAAGPMQRIYRAAQYAPVWQAVPDAARRRESLLVSVSRTAEEGLPANLFPARKILQSWSDPPDALASARRDIDLTKMLYDYVAGQRHGFVPRAALGGDWTIEDEPFDVADAIIAAVNANDIGGLLAAAPPSTPQYQNLRTALVRLNAVAAAGGWPVIPGAEEVVLGAGDARESLLGKRLIVEGDLPAEAVDDKLAFSAALRQFQSRHGLDPDGRVGRHTLAALRVTTQERIAAISANLERWRHLPRAWGARYVHVNAADASLVLVESGGEALRMRTIIGDPDHPTPVMRATIAAVTLNPPWTIPHSIAVKEMLPSLRKNPRYLADNNIVIVDGPPEDPHGLNVDWKKISAKAFPFVLRQQPGTRNALGAVKFEMANGNAVFLHDTPGKALFARADRSLSHGCVRLELPIDLACHLLFGAAAEDNRSDLVKIIESGATRTMPVPAPLPVYILYWTAFVNRDGKMNFRPDPYGRDAATIDALASLGARIP